MQRMGLFIRNNGNTGFPTGSSIGGGGPSVSGIPFRGVGGGSRRIPMSVGYNASIFERMRKPGCSSCGK